MARYAVIKFFGHFRQTWTLSAESEEDAWNRAEKDGHLEFQAVYRDVLDLDSKGYVVNLNEKQKECSSISTQQYNIWLKEAIEKGMVCKPEEYEQVYGLPFQDAQ